MNAENIHQSLATGIQKLRKDRGITQAGLARLLNLSQAQLSKIENGTGSITAEQLVYLLQEYSLPLSYFIPNEKKAENEEEPFLQSALTYLGANHLRIIPGVNIPERLIIPEEAIFEVLLSPSSRLVTALAPIIVKHCESINFLRIAERLKGHGVERRIWWVVDCIYNALSERLKETYLSRDQYRLYQKAFILLERKKLDVYKARNKFEEDFDEFDRDLISARTIQLVKDNLDETAELWGIVTRIKEQYFQQALKDSEET
jgi:transcriptional regulator with XRE-family HTH domain